MIKNLKDQKGAALVLTLMTVFVLLVIGSSFILRAVNEWATAQRERRIAQVFAIGEGAAAAAIEKLDELINTDMLNTINLTSPQTVGNKAKKAVQNKDALGFLTLYVKKGTVPQLTLNGSQAIYTQSSSPLGAGSYSFTVVISQKTDPVTVGVDIWDFPFNYRVQGQGQLGEMTTRVSYFGDFTVRVQRDNFARYALFTDHHGLPSGSTVWFTNNTHFSGPLHTNELYSFVGAPNFDGQVTQHHNQAQFYNNGNPFTADADTNPPRDVPTFGSYTRGVNEIVLSSSVQKSDLYTQARGSDSSQGNGIFIANNGTAVTAGIYVNGNSTIDLGKDANGNAQYSITQGALTKVVTVDRVNNQTKVQSGGTTKTYSGVPDGVDNVGTIVYADGNVNSLKGVVQKDTEITISAENDVIITDNLIYEDYNAGSGTPGQPGYIPPNAENKMNLLGLVSWGGNVRVGTTAPNNVNIHGVVMARNGVFQVDNYNSRNPSGTATLLGGAITQFYGAFGTFSGTTGQIVSGYGRNFVYDGRTQMGNSPPYFPSMNTFIAFTNDITDKMAYREGGF